jgi:hypothetical protein
MSFSVIRSNNNCYTYDEQVDRGDDKEMRTKEGGTIHSDVLEDCSKTDLILGNLGKLPVLPLLLFHRAFSYN